MRVPKLILIMLTFAVSEPSAGMEISRQRACSGGDILRLRGSIERGDYLKFRSHFSDERRVVGLNLDSGGGSLDEGIRIAALTRQKRLSTFVSKECHSACAFIFFLGAKRYIGKDAKIGVHSVSNDYGSEDNGAIRDTIYFARLSAKLGIPSSTIGKMVATPPGRITFLDQADLLALKVIVRDPFARKVSETQSCSSARGSGEVSIKKDTPDRYATVSSRSVALERERKSLKFLQRRALR